MAFAAVMGVASLASGIFGGASAQASQRRAQQAAVKLQNEKDEALYKRSLDEWKLDYESKLTKYAWDQAQISQLRYNERLKNYDQTSYAGKLIEAAGANLSLNLGVLQDRYVQGEQIRGFQEQSGYLYAQNKLGTESLYQVGQFMGQINQRAEQTNQAGRKLESDMQELVTSLGLKRQQEQLGWNLKQVAALVEGSQVDAVATTRSGGGQSAKLMANDAMKSLGRLYGVLEISNADRGRQLQLANRTMNNEVASQFAQVALADKETLNGISNTVNMWQQGQEYAKGIFQNVTIPGFQQANAQYGRELQGLWLKTKSSFDEASMPYREASYFDPLHPIAGLKPTKAAPQQVYSSGFGSTLSSITQGIQQGYSTYKAFGGDLSNLFGRNNTPASTPSFSWSSISGANLGNYSGFGTAGTDYSSVFSGGGGFGSSGLSGFGGAGASLGF